MQGQCTCGKVRFRMTKRPLFVHACHCSWCQRETGSAFALNALIEMACVQVLAGEVEEVVTPTASGRGQIIARCPACHVALWSHYAGAGRKAAFVRVGTLVEPAACPPDIHIFTSSKQPWLVLDDKVPVVAEYYDRREMWPDWALARSEVMRRQA